LAQELADAFCEPSRLREIAARHPAEAVERAIAEIEQDDEEMGEEIRDLLR
jgi:phosphoribosyl-ATP pyrophosphohydrolase